MKTARIVEAFRLITVENFGRGEFEPKKTDFVTTTLSGLAKSVKEMGKVLFGPHEESVVQDWLKQSKSGDKGYFYEERCVAMTKERGLDSGRYLEESEIVHVTETQ